VTGKIRKLVSEGKRKRERKREREREKREGDSVSKKTK
jgi:hypothetical protein